jgi:trimethylamine--corrinoid protein Co-methyltransferase
VWGGAAAIFDMRKGATPMGAVESAMLDCSYAQVAKSLGMPTHTYLGATDSKLVDAQAGLESGITAMVGALSGINMISGSGMLDFLACHSAEKLVIDSEGIAMAKRMIEGVKLHTEHLATDFYDSKINFKGGDFLKQKITMQLFRKEQHLPSNIIDRDSVRGWKESGGLDAFGRAKIRVQELLASYAKPELDPIKVADLHAFMRDLAKQAGMDSLPAHDLSPAVV